MLLLIGTQAGETGSIGVYLPSNWEVPFGIVLVVDRLSALMLVLTGSSASAHCCSPWPAGTAPVPASTRCSRSN
ncbi:hypothetical protein QNM99_09870 [Pseudomonas sp. PCH446]